MDLDFYLSFLFSLPPFIPFIPSFLSEACLYSMAYNELTYFVFRLFGVYSCFSWLVYSKGSSSDYRSYYLNGSIIALKVVQQILLDNQATSGCKYEGC